MAENQPTGDVEQNSDQVAALSPPVLDAIQAAVAAVLAAQQPSGDSPQERSGSAGKQIVSTHTVAIAVSLCTVAWTPVQREDGSPRQLPHRCR